MRTEGARGTTRFKLQSLLNMLVAFVVNVNEPSESVSTCVCLDPIKWTA